MEIEIIKNVTSKSENIKFNFNDVRNKPITDQELYEYQQIFGKIVADNTDNYSYLFSDLLNREDGSTHFFDKMLKFIDCLTCIDNSLNNVTICNIDRSVLISIRNYCASRNIKTKYSIINITFNTLLNYSIFIIRSFRAFFCDSILKFYAKYKLNNKINKSITKVFISYFDYRSIAKNKFTDPFFRPLQEYLQEINVSFAVVNIMVYGYNIRRGLKQINQIKKLNNPNIISLFNLIPPYGILLTFYKSYKLQPKLKQEVFFRNVNISDLLRESLKKELFTASLQYTIERLYLSNLLEYKSVETIYYPFENFAWEKFLCLEKHKLNSNLKLVGFQHTCFSLKLQHHFPSEHERLLHIFPSKILTTGEMSKSILQKYGSYPINILQTGCALRHEYIFDILSDYKYSHKIHRRIAFAFSFDISRYGYIIEKIISIFGGKNIEVILKYHPLNKEYYYNNKMPTNITNGIDLSWKETMGQIDLLLYEGNSVCIDALAYNIPALYFPFTGEIYNTDQLYNYEWELDAGDDEATYYSKVEEILKMNLRNNTEFFNYNRKYVESYFRPITEEALKEFLV